MIFEQRKFLLLIMILLFSCSNIFGALSSRCRNGRMEIGVNNIYFLINDNLYLLDAKWRRLASPFKTKAKSIGDQEGTVAHSWRHNKLELTREVTQPSKNEISVRYKYSAPSGLGGKESYLTLCFPGSNVLGMSKLFNGKKKIKINKPLLFNILTGGIKITFSGTKHVSLEDRSKDKWSHYRLKIWNKYIKGKGLDGNITINIKYTPSINPAFKTIKLGIQGQRPLVDNEQRTGWTGQGSGNDLSTLKPGLLIASGVPFRISDKAVVLRSSHTTQQPLTSGIIKTPLIDFESIYVLHTTAWSTRGAIANYKLTYKDGSVKKIPVIYAKDINDWWNAKPPSDAKIGWVGNNQSTKVGISLMKIENPFSGKKLKTIELISTNTDCPPIWLAATVLKRGALDASSIALLDSLFERKEKKLNVKDWYPCKIDWCGQIKQGSALDFSFLNHKPAGKFGFVRRKSTNKANFEFSGRPIGKLRFWGTNAAIYGAFPPKELAPKIAHTFAAQGVNLVRFHMIAKSIKLLFDKEGNMNLKMLDRMEFFIGELKKRGIYIVMALNDGIMFDTHLGRKFVWPQPSSFASLFSKELQKSLTIFAKKTFTHKNPYTGLALVNDPALALFELINERTILKPRGKLLPKYEKELNNLWLAWLKKNNISSRKLPKNFKFSAEGRKFASEIYKNYLVNMKKMARSIGVKVPICGSTTHFGVADIVTEKEAGMDFMSGHSYYDFQRGGIYPKASSPTSYNDSTPLNARVWNRWSMMNNICSMALDDAPLLLGEWNYCYPNTYRNVGVPILAALSAYQDIDALTFYCAFGTGFGSKFKGWGWYKKNPRIFIHSQQTDPATWGMSQVGAAMFRRQDVSTAKKQIKVVLPISAIDKGINYMDTLSFLPALGHVSMSFSDSPNWLGKLAVSKKSSKTLYLTVLKRFDDKNSNLKQIISDTKQIRRYSNPGIFIVDTPKTQSVSGQLSKLKKIKDKLSSVNIKSSMKQGSLCLVSIDGQPIDKSKRMLLIAVANAANKTIKYAPADGLLYNYGNSPVLAEPFTATVEIKTSIPNQKVFALDTLTGIRKKELKASRSADKFSFNILPNDKTIYYEIISESNK